MAKKILLNEPEIDEILAELKTQLSCSKNFGSVSFTKSFTKDDRAASVYFTADAWNKMQSLIRTFDTEVQWHGCVKRLDESKFVIYDILVPPHVVTGATVTSDPAKYSEWINGLDDEKFADLKFHGHSHVNMGCTPSGTDMKYRSDVVTQLPVPGANEDSYYIFLIFNKKGEFTGEIYDLKYNALYASTDIVIDVYTEEGFLSDFIEDAKKVAIKEVPVTTSYANKYGYGAGVNTPGASTPRTTTPVKQKSPKKAPPTPDFDASDEDWTQWYRDYYGR